MSTLGTLGTEPSVFSHTSAGYIHSFSVLPTIHTHTSFLQRQHTRVSQRQGHACSIGARHKKYNREGSLGVVEPEHRVEDTEQDRAERGLSCSPAGPMDGLWEAEAGTLPWASHRQENSEALW